MPIATRPEIWADWRAVASQFVVPLTTLGAGCGPRDRRDELAAGRVDANA